MFKDTTCTDADSWRAQTHYSGIISPELSRWATSATVTEAVKHNELCQWNISAPVLTLYRSTPANVWSVAGYRDSNFLVASNEEPGQGSEGWTN